MRLLRLRPRTLPLGLSLPPFINRHLSTTHPLTAGPKPLPPLPKLNDNEITESFVKGSGPGGQVINKTSSAVQLKHLPTGIVVKSQATRSRAQNRSIARRLLQEKIEEHELGDQARTRVKEEKQRKKSASKAKKSRRKYRALEEGKGKGGVEGEGGGDGAGGEDVRVVGEVNGVKGGAQLTVRRETDHAREHDGGGAGKVEGKPVADGLKGDKAG
ncbi:RF-1 domain-containing protein 2 [Elsinoe australis]|uniref:RF-1 domain-containing protein 2 n=1 Tax=Elsinoe australis TaxID=40998 RepID=A0A4U7AN56_9PEZI|nr:RF-1 domain-containing protein 2 [Elsinoe australis]